jgi:hypothetical protein
MKLYNKWRNIFESYLHFCIAKIQYLEGIEDKPVDHDTKLSASGSPNNLSSKPDMDTAIRQAITNELTIHSTKDFQLNFYNMVLSNAKLLDSTRSKQTGRRQEKNQANQNNTSRGNITSWDP